MLDTSLLRLETLVISAPLYRASSLKLHHAGAWWGMIGESAETSPQKVKQVSSRCWVCLERMSVSLPQKVRQVSSRCWNITTKWGEFHQDAGNITTKWGKFSIMVPTNYQTILSSSSRMLFKHDSASWMLAWLCVGMFQHFCWGMMMELASLSSSIIYCLKPTTKQQSANYVLGPSGNLRCCFFCSVGQQDRGGQLGGFGWG